MTQSLLDWPLFVRIGRRGELKPDRLFPDGPRLFRFSILDSNNRSLEAASDPQQDAIRFKAADGTRHFGLHVKLRIGPNHGDSPIEAGGDEMLLLHFRIINSRQFRRLNPN